MKRVLTCAGVTMLTLAGACSDSTSPSSSDPLALQAAFQTTTIGFSNVNSSFSSSADTGPFVPGGPGNFERIGGLPGRGLMGGGLGPDFVGDVLFNAGREGRGPGRGFDHGPFGYDHPRADCAFDATTNRLNCSGEYRGGVTVSTSFQFKDAGGNIQHSPDSTTDYVN